MEANRSSVPGARIVLLVSHGGEPVSRIFVKDIADGFRTADDLIGLVDNGRVEPIPASIDDVARLASDIAILANGRSDLGLAARCIEAAMDGTEPPDLIRRALALARSHYAEGA